MSDDLTRNLQAGDAPRVEVLGYPEPPAIVPLSEARGNRKLAIRTRLDQLSANGPGQYGETAMQRLAHALGDLAERLSRIDARSDVTTLEAWADALEDFHAAPEEMRSTRTLWERTRGEAAPRDRLLGRLQNLRSAILPFDDPQQDRWRDLAASYLEAYRLTVELGDAISAGRARMARTNADLRPAHDQALRINPEDRGEESETALTALKAARDDIERRVHALRGTHRRAVDALTALRALAGAHQDYRNVRKIIDMRVVPTWDRTITGFIDGRADDSGDEEDTAAEAIARVKAANVRLAGEFRRARSTADRRDAAMQAAQAAMNPARDR